MANGSSKSSLFRFARRVDQPELQEHAEIVAHRIPGARLVAVTDPVEINAKRVAADLDADAADLAEVLARTDVGRNSAPVESHFLDG